MGYPIIIDILGNELKIGDVCAYIKSECTGSSTTRKVLHVGKITAMYSKTVVFDNEIKVYKHNDIVKMHGGNA